MEITAACKKHNQPHITERAKDITIGAIGDLLNGGYDLALIRSVALNLALEYDDVRGYSKLMQLRMRVRAEQDQINLDAHKRQKLAERSPFPMATLEDVRRLDPRRTQAEAITEAERILFARTAYSPVAAVPVEGNHGDEPTHLSNGRRHA